MWQAAHQNQCRAFLQAGKLVEAHGAYTYMVDMYDEATKASCIEWSTGECSVELANNTETRISSSIQEGMQSCLYRKC